MPAAAFELGQMERVVLIEFDSVESAKAAYASPAYQKAHDLLGDGADRDIRIVEAADWRGIGESWASCGDPVP